MSDASETPFIPSYDTCDDVSDLCPLSETLYGYRPNLGAAIFFAAVFTICFLAQIVFAFRMRSHAFATWMLIGVGCEVAGYFARISLWSNPWTFGAMAAHMITLVLAPSLVNAAISVTFKHIILYCGEQYSKLRAKWYPIVFIGTDFVSILIQVIGAGLSAVATSGATDDQSLLDAASGILIAGVSFQVANMVICGLVLLVFIWNYRKAKNGNHSYPGVVTAYEEDKSISNKARTKFHCFIAGVAVAYVTILIRCCYRVPEMAGGWRGDLMRNEASFLVLDGMMLIIACVVLTIFHPAHFFPPMMKNSPTGTRALKSSGSENGLASTSEERVQTDASGIELQSRP